MLPRQTWKHLFIGRHMSTFTDSVSIVEKCCIIGDIFYIFNKCFRLFYTQNYLRIWIDIGIKRAISICFWQYLKIDSSTIYSVENIMKQLKLHLFCYYVFFCSKYVNIYSSLFSVFEITHIVCQGNYCTSCTFILILVEWW